MDSLVYELFLKEDPEDNVRYRILNVPESSFRKFAIEDIEVIMNHSYLGGYRYGGENLISYNIDYQISKKYMSQKLYTICQYRNLPYNLIVEYTAGLIENSTDRNNNKTTKQLGQRTSHKFIIPGYVGYGGTSPLDTKYQTQFPDNYCVGGFSILNDGQKRYTSNRKELQNAQPKFKRLDHNTEHMAFSSIPPRFSLDNSRNQYLTLQLSTSEKFRFDVQSAKTFMSCNIILLIHYLIEISISTIEKIIIQGFDKDIHPNIKIIFSRTRDLLLTYNNINSYMNHMLSLFNSSNDNLISLDSHIDSFLPHMNNRFSKGLYLLSIIRRFIMACFQNDIYPNRDNAITKRVAPIGLIYEEYIRTSINNIINEFRRKLSDDKLSPLEIFRNLPFDQQTNLFGNMYNMKDSKNSRIIKLSPNANRFNDVRHGSLVVHGGNVKLTKNLQARENEPSTLSFEDSVDTPDRSDSIGLVKSMSVITSITHYGLLESKELYKNIRKLVYKHIGESMNILNRVMCIISDISDLDIIFMTQEQSDSLIQKIKTMKRNNVSNFRYVGIENRLIHKFDNIKQIRVPTNLTSILILNISSKRYIKPFFVITDGKAELDKLSIEDIQKHKTISSLIEEYPNVIEFLDPGQVEWSNIIVDYTTYLTLSEKDRKLFDYIEISQGSNFGISTSLVPDVGRSPGFRNTFAGGQQKQIPRGLSSNVLSKYESGNCLLNPSERPCVTNKVIEHSGISMMGGGKHVWVLLCSFPYAIEDALGLRRTSVERGLFDTISTHAYKTILSDANLRSPTPNKTNNDYSKLDDSGLPPVGSLLSKNHAWCKNINIIFKENIQGGFDDSDSIGFRYPVYIDRVKKSGFDVVTINILGSIYKPVTEGDKFANQGAQKGTVGKLYEDYELPRTKDGIFPDIIINSTSIVARNTIPVLIQGILTKAFGYFPFDESGNLQFREYDTMTNIDIEESIKSLKEEYRIKYLDKSEKELDDMLFGNEIMYDAYGDRYKEPMVLLPLYYGRSNQMSVDRLAYRSGGKVNTSGVPTSGIKKGGGQRTGEMEMDILCTHGGSNIIYEHATDIVSIRRGTYYCTNCFTPATKEVLLDNIVRWKCDICENRQLSSDIKIFRFTHAFKQFKTFSRARGINIIVKDKESEPMFSYESEN